MRLRCTFVVMSRKKIDKRTIIGTISVPDKPPFPVIFLKLASSKEPVREWLKDLDRADRKRMGKNIKTLQYGWPIGMPLARKLETNLWELRTDLEDGTARVFFTIYRDNIVLLHAFAKKTRKTPPRELILAKQRLATLRRK